MVVLPLRKLRVWHGFQLRAADANIAIVEILIVLVRCRVPDDSIDPRRFPLFLGREVMRRLIDDLRATV